MYDDKRTKELNEKEQSEGLTRKEYGEKFILGICWQLERYLESGEFECITDVVEYVCGYRCSWDGEKYDISAAPSVIDDILGLSLEEEEE